MSKKHVFYTDVEDAVIIEEISNSPQNLANAFSQAALRLRGRDAASISARYYGKLKSNSKALVLMTNKGAMMNTKNMVRMKMPEKSIAMEVAEFALEKLTRDEKINLAKQILETT